MENDLISRSKAIRWIKAECNPYGQPTLDYESGIKVIEHLERMSSAQPEIIRCKDCLWRIGRDCARFTDLPVYMDDYCGRAKRKGEQDEIN